MSQGLLRSAMSKGLLHQNPPNTPHLGTCPPGKPFHPQNGFSAAKTVQQPTLTTLKHNYPHASASLRVPPKRAAAVRSRPVWRPHREDLPRRVAPHVLEALLLVADHVCGLPARQRVEHPAALLEEPVVLLLEELEVEPLAGIGVLASELDNRLGGAVVHNVHRGTVNLDIVRVARDVEELLKRPDAREEEGPLDLVDGDLARCRAQWLGRRGIQVLRAPPPRGRGPFGRVGGSVRDADLAAPIDLAFPVHPLGLQPHPRARLDGKGGKVEEDAARDCDGEVLEERDDGDNDNDEDVSPRNLVVAPRELPHVLGQDGMED
mmetsp:Transcript_1703/g.4308  ORF Transcript_1703/g.4308 Transcript_1703/m.4308 type:complete len:320 (+) Transcript_1703:115-1074(+)